MEFAVLVKQVPDCDEVKMDPVKGTMLREGVGCIVNPLDLHALEAALRLRDHYGGRITTLSMGPSQATEALTETLALGADRGILLSDRAFAGADSWATAAVLAAGLRRTGPYDLILAGEKATDGETGQVGPEVAAMMDLPFATYVTDIQADQASLTIRRTLEEGVQRQRLPFPCLLTVLSDLNETSMPTLAGYKRAWRSEIPRLTLEDLELDPGEVGLSGSPTRVVRIEHPKLSRQAEIFSGSALDRGVDRVVELLRELALV